MIKQFLNFMIDKSKEVVIVAAVRTPIGSYKGSLKDMRADQLGSIVINGVLKKSKFNKEEIDEVIMGQVLTAGGGKTLQDKQQLMLVYLSQNLLI